MIVCCSCERVGGGMVGGSLRRLCDKMAMGPWEDLRRNRERIVGRSRENAERTF